MYVVIGSKKFDDNTVNVSSFTQRVKRSRRDRPEILTKRLSLRGVIIKSTQAEIRTEIEEMEKALIEDPTMNAGLYHDDQSPSPHFLNGTASLSGIRILNKADYPVGDGAEYATQRTFTIDLEADFRIASSNLIEFREALTIVGTGGRRKVEIETVAGPPIRQVVNQSTVQRITQTGVAVGRTTWPTSLPAPLFPEQHEDLDRRVIDPQSPERFGLGFTNYAIRWSYFFTLLAPTAPIYFPRRK